MHHTKEKGDLGVLKAQVSLHEQGWIVCIPLTEHAPFDLIACKDNKIYRIQVRYRTLKKGVIPIMFRTCWNDRNGTHIKQTNKSEVDRYCAYCPNTDKCYFFDPQKFSKSVNLRLDTTKNNQKNGIHLADDYLILN